jgi:hypothetical protein
VLVEVGGADDRRHVRARIGVHSATRGLPARVRIWYEALA